MLTDAEVLSAISAAEATAFGTVQGDIASDRADAVDRYLGKPYGDEQAGRSSVVSRDVADVVEGVLANVLKPFVSGDRMVQFDPRGPEDQEASEQETDYVNFVALERNNGFLVLNSAVKDALLLRNGYVKCGWTKRDDVMLESYIGQSDDELALLMQDEDVEIVQHTEYPDPAPQMGPDGQVPMLHDVKVRRKRPTEFVETMPVPPDEILVSQRHTGPSLQTCDFVQHRTHLMLSEIRQLGYDVPDDISDDDNGETIEDFARQRFGDGNEFDDPTNDPSRRLVLFKETWIRVDRDEDGIAELRRVCHIGEQVLADEEADIIPVACFTGVVMPHQHLGVSIYDMVQDLAKLKTALLRQFMDNKYLANNGRYAVDVNRVNLDDMLVSRPGGIVRVTEGDPSTAVIPLVAPDTGPSALAGLEYLDSIRENRTGYTRYAQGMQSDTLVNKTATGLMQATNQSQMRLEMVSRTIAETGVRDLFRIVHALTLKHSTRAEKVRLRNKWVLVNPREWVRRTDLSIAVGLGAGTGEQAFAKLTAMVPLQQQAMAMGLAGPDEAYNFGVELWKAAGFKNPDLFLKAPQKEPVIDPQTGQPKIGSDGKPVMQSKMPPPQKPPEVQAAEVQSQGLAQAEQIKGQVAMQKHTTPDATEIQKAYISAAKDIKVATAKNALDGAKVGLQAQQQSHDQQMDKVSNLTDLIHSIRGMVETMNAPREIVRDKTGRASGVRVVR